VVPAKSTKPAKQAKSASDFPGADRWVPADAPIARLREAAQDCRGCNLYVDATQAVMGQGPVDAALMLIGEQPGDKEDLAGQPFMGPAGKLLSKALEVAGIPPETVFRTNAVKHFRFSGTPGKRRIHASPDLVHMVACAPWLAAELNLVQPRGVVALGATAGEAIFRRSFKVTASRCQILAWPESFTAAAKPDWVVATIHPSAVLRSPDRDAALEGLVADLQVAAAAM